MEKGADPATGVPFIGRYNGTAQRQNGLVSDRQGAVQKTRPNPPAHHLPGADGAWLRDGGPLGLQMHFLWESFRSRTTGIARASGRWAITARCPGPIFSGPWTVCRLTTARRAGHGQPARRDSS